MNEHIGQVRRTGSASQSAAGDVEESGGVVELGEDSRLVAEWLDSEYVSRTASSKSLEVEKGMRSGSMVVCRYERLVLGGALGTRR
jgi:hypothetical protein